MKHREKPKYSVRQNVCFMVRTAWEKRRRVPLLCVVVAAIKVALDLAQLYVTPEILTRVEQGVPVGELLTTIGFFTAALLLLQGAAAYCDAIRMPGEEDVYPPQKPPAAPTVSSRSLFACTWRRLSPEASPIKR